MPRHHAASRRRVTAPHYSSPGLHLDAYEASCAKSEGSRVSEAPRGKPRLAPPRGRRGRVPSPWSPLTQSAGHAPPLAALPSLCEAHRAGRVARAGAQHMRPLGAGLPHEQFNSLHLCPLR